MSIREELASRRPGNRKLTDEALESAIGLRDAGSAWRTIGTLLGVDESTVRRAVERYRAKRAREGA